MPNINICIVITVLLPYTDSHLECHLEFLYMLNGDKMPSTGSINVNKIATKLFGVKIFEFWKASLSNSAFSLSFDSHL